MTFLDPTALALAAGLTVPALVAMYFLKLKRTARVVPSTLLWKRAVEDLHVNAPFQRLRSSLLLLLQLLVLLVAALALGKPMFQTAERHEDTLIILVDQSASMNVKEADGRSRLDLAKEQARLRVDNMSDHARAMLIAFCDRATVISSFDTNKDALKRLIDSIPATESTTNLGEAMSLAEAYTQNIIIGGEETGADVAPESSAPPATVFLITDGRIEDAEQVALQKFDKERIHVANVGQRVDNVGIVAMDARRNYERPEILEVAATVENFGPDPVTVDAVLYVDGDSLDVQTVALEGRRPAVGDGDAGGGAGARESIGVAAFDPVEFGGGGVVQVTLRVDDALPADDRAWTILDPPRHVRVLLVTEGSLPLEDVLPTLPIELVKMTPAEYEAADEKDLQSGERSLYDVVIMERHSTARLPHGNYFFWAAVPRIEGIAAGEPIRDEIVVNWDETHPLLRHVAVETLFVLEWLRLSVPPEAVSVIEGESSPILTYFVHGASQYLVSAFSLTVDDADGTAWLNTRWVATVDFVVFMQNAVQFLSSNVALRGARTVRPGEPVTMPSAPGTERIQVIRPDGSVDMVTATTYQKFHYAATRQTGIYRADPGVAGHDRFAVNLFNFVESDVSPATAVTIGTERIDSQAGQIDVNEPAWPYLLVVMLAVLIFEWVVYNRRVLV